MWPQCGDLVILKKATKSSVSGDEGIIKHRTKNGWLRVLVCHTGRVVSVRANLYHIDKPFQVRHKCLRAVPSDPYGCWITSACCWWMPLDDDARRRQEERYGYGETVEWGGGWDKLEPKPPTTTPPPSPPTPPSPPPKPTRTCEGRRATVEQEAKWWAEAVAANKAKKQQLLIATQPQPTSAPMIALPSPEVTLPNRENRGRRVSFVDDPVVRTAKRCDVWVWTV